MQLSPDMSISTKKHRNSKDLSLSSKSKIQKRSSKSSSSSSSSPQTHNSDYLRQHLQRLLTDGPSPTSSANNHSGNRDLPLTRRQSRVIDAKYSRARTTIEYILNSAVDDLEMTRLKTAPYLNQVSSIESPRKSAIVRKSRPISLQFNMTKDLYLEAGESTPSDGILTPIKGSERERTEEAVMVYKTFLQQHHTVALRGQRELEGREGIDDEL